MKKIPIIVILLSFLIFLNTILLLGILKILPLEDYLSQFEFVKHLKQLYGGGSKNGFNFVNIVTSFGASISFLIWHLRNEAMNKQTKSQYDTFNEDKKFSNFLEATKLLTDKDSTTEAKIAAMFSLADVAIVHPKHLDRIIQVLNKELTLLMDIINENNIKNKPLDIDLLNRDSREIIKNWQHNGNEAEKTVSVALYVIRKIILELESFDSKFDFSNTIFFDIDHDFDEKSIGKKFIRKGNKRIENAIFLNCKLEKVDFRETIFHFCKFINCDLSEADFSNANLWGALFNNCNLKEVKFTDVGCEGIEFINCKNLLINTLNQSSTDTIDKVKSFKFIDDNGTEYTRLDINYLIILDSKTFDKKIIIDENLNPLLLEDFITLEEYKQWKNSDKN